MLDATGYRPSLKCTWVDGITHYKEMVEAVNRDKQRAVLTMGPYVLSEQFKHLEVSLLKWSKMGGKQKLTHLAKVDSSCKRVDEMASDLKCPDKSDVETSTTVTADSREMINNVRASNLPEFLRGSWNNACKIVEQGGVGAFPNNIKRRTVISLTSPTVHTVEIRGDGKQFVCDPNCPRFKECSICAHTIAVAYTSGKLDDFVTAYEVPLSQMVQMGIPARTGKKDNEKVRKRKRAENDPRDVSAYGERENKNAYDS